MGTKDLAHKAIARALANGEPLTHDQRAALLSLVADDKVWQRKHDEMAAELASMRQCFEAADRERSELRARAERAEAERDALRADAERSNEIRRLAIRALCAWDESVLPKSHDGMMQERMEDLRAAIAQQQAEPVTAPPIWETLAEIGESAPAGTWDALTAGKLQGQHQ